jgi:hypothetical protein
MSSTFYIITLEIYQKGAFIFMQSKNGRASMTVSRSMSMRSRSFFAEDKSPHASPPTQCGGKLGGEHAAWRGHAGAASAAPVFVTTVSQLRMGIVCIT